MTLAIDAHRFGGWMMVIGAVFAWYFVIRYAFRPWHRSGEGRALMFLFLVMSLVLTHASVLFLYGHYPHDVEVRLIVLAGAGLGIAVFALTFFPLWHSPRRSRRNRVADSD